jgi:hypothetical protein
MKLNNDFILERYGLKLRFVDVYDAEYIFNLRTDPLLGRFINKTSHHLSDQIQWIKQYKGREAEGLEYYFIFTKDDCRVGVIRIYNIEKDNATSGSWICSPNLPFEIPTLIVLIMREIFFETLEIENELMDTRLGNKKVIRMHKLFGAEIIRQDEIDVFHLLTKKAFLVNKQKILSYVGQNEDT